MTMLQFRLRLRIMGVTSFMLLFLVITMIFFHRLRIHKRKHSMKRILRQREYEIRKTVLEKAARSTECLNAEQRYLFFKDIVDYPNISFQTFLQFTKFLQLFSKANTALCITR